ncbi:hypothetical protein EHP00_1776 [Ecytonucleospora hepatopenaei]|uniref:Phosphatidylinositol transfer protein N-terminal domain-containing protein n=1 Tax=Ecytonucleospora hepatopenaei TaxID=646526 RepID=A0A1W0E4H3_9MICR|nr:hypothetical protein EHP00_1776 [Ecytonucleospora hepatopenaei]
MTVAKKVFKIKVPFSLEEYRKGYRYALSKYTTDEVQFVKMTREKSIDKIITETHKVLNLGKRMPFMVRKVIPTAACMVEEFSTNVDSIKITSDGVSDTFEHFHQTTDIKQNDLNVNKERTVDTVTVANTEHVIADEKIKILDKDGTELPVEETAKIINERLDVQKNKSAKDLKIDERLKVNEKNIKNTLGISETEMREENSKKTEKNSLGKAHCQKEKHQKYEEEGHYTTTKYKNMHFDESTFKMNIDTKVTTNEHFKFNTDAPVEVIDFRTYFKEKMVKVDDRDYSGNFSERYPCVYVYKFVEVEINSKLLGWISKEVVKSLRDSMVELTRDVIRFHKEWKNMKEEELDKYEDEVVKKFMQSK